MFGGSVESGNLERYQNMFKPPASPAGPGTAVAPGKPATPPGRNIVVNGGTVNIVNPPENSNIIINGGNVTIINPLDIGGTGPRPGTPPAIPGNPSGGSNPIPRIPEDRDGPMSRWYRKYFQRQSEGPSTPSAPSGPSTPPRPVPALPMPEIQSREKPITLQPYSSMSTIKCHQPQTQPKNFDLLESYAPRPR